MPVTGWDWTDQSDPARLDASPLSTPTSEDVLVRERDVAAGRHDVGVVTTDLADVRAVSESLERVPAQEYERMRRGQIVPAGLEALRAVRVAYLPQQIDHLAVYANRPSPAGGGIEQRRDRALKPFRIRRIGDHDSREKFGGVFDDEVAGALERCDGKAADREQCVDARGMLRCGDDQGRLPCIEPFCEEVGDDLTETIVVVIEPNGVKETLTVHHLFVSSNDVHEGDTLTAVDIGATGGLPDVRLNR